MVATKISEVFKTSGTPTVTYVERDKGTLEFKLKAGLDDPGQLCLLTGPSKTGKTTLYQRVIESDGYLPLIARCEGTMEAGDVWRKALERLDFSRVSQHSSSTGKERKASTRARASVGWKWLANLTGEIAAGISDSSNESEIREKILSKPSPEHLVPALKYLPYVLVVEDFHYLDSGTQKHVFQQWKTFTDEGISVIVLGTTHHAIDIAQSNRDLLGRINHIEVDTWSVGDLKKIVDKGMTHLAVQCSSSLGQLIAEESAGLPLITQQVCQEIFFRNKMQSFDPSNDQMELNKNVVKDALHGVAKDRYKTLEHYYNVIVTGPRKRARKYNTYELILSCFAVPPVKGHLERHEIEERIRKLGIEDDEVPPQASINSTLNALAKFQDRNNLELLEWVPKEKTLYILEPSFLFYLRWRQPKRDDERSDIARLFFEIFRARDDGQGSVIVEVDNIFGRAKKPKKTVK